MTYNPDIHHRQSIRLKGFDYSSAGAYFVTICTKNREPFFGNIRNGIMGLNHLGCIAHLCWNEIPNHFPFVVPDEFVVMPDHVHGILWLNTPTRRDAINRVPTGGDGGITGKHNPMGKGTLGEIIRWVKGRTTFEIRQKTHVDFSWQSRFHDRIVRNEDELNRIRSYIRHNPENWRKK